MDFSNSKRLWPFDVQKKKKKVQFDDENDLVIEFILLFAGIRANSVQIIQNLRQHRLFYERFIVKFQQTKALILLLCMAADRHLT